MIERYIQQLKSPDPAARRAAIVALANSKDAAALGPLGEVYRSDPEPALRELALKAGQYISQAQTAAGRTSQPTGRASQTPTDSGASYDSSSAYSTPYDLSSIHDPPPSSPEDIQKAKAYYETAMTYHLKGDRIRAIDYLGKAAQANPAITRKQEFMGLAVSVTNLPVSEALKVISKPQNYPDMVAPVGSHPLQRQKAAVPAAESPWGAVLIDLGLYWLIIILAALAIYAFGINSLIDLIHDLPQLPTSSYSSPSYQPVTEEDLNKIKETGLLVMIPVGIAAGLSAIVGLLIQTFCIHLAATMVMGGSGTWVDLLRDYVPYQTIVTFLMAIGFVLLLALLKQPGIPWLILLAMMFGSLAALYWASAIVGKVHGFGTGNGCVAIFLGGIVYGVFYCMLNFVCSSVTSGANTVGNSP
jgi:hypothetical protein